MTGQESDKVQREIEELLEKLDNFVPEERLASKIRHRRKQQKQAERTGPTAWESLRSRLGGITLGQLMVAGLICLAVAWLGGGLLGDMRPWVLGGGLLLTLAAFALSAIGGRGSSATIGGRVQRRWRGQVIEYSEPSRFDRMRAWIRRRSGR